MIASMLYGQNEVKEPEINGRTINFPKQNIKVQKMPERHKLWFFILAGQSNMAGRGFVEPATL